MQGDKTLKSSFQHINPKNLFNNFIIRLNQLIPQILNCKRISNFHQFMNNYGNIHANLTLPAINVIYKLIEWVLKSVLNETQYKSAKNNCSNITQKNTTKTRVNVSVSYSCNLYRRIFFINRKQTVYAYWLNEKKTLRKTDFRKIKMKECRLNNVGGCLINNWILKAALLESSPSHSLSVQVGKSLRSFRQWGRSSVRCTRVGMC